MDPFYKELTDKKQLVVAHRWRYATALCYSATLPPAATYIFTSLHLKIDLRSKRDKLELNCVF